MRVERAVHQPEHQLAEDHGDRDAEDARLTSRCDARGPARRAGAPPCYFFGASGHRPGDRAERLLAVHRLHHLVVVPRIFRFLRRLHLHDVHVVDHGAVGADVAALGEHVVDLGLLQLRHDLVGIGRAGRLDGLQVGQGGRVGAGLVHGRLLLHLGEEALGEGARLVVQVPVPAGGQVQPLRGLQPQAVDVGDEGEQRRRLHGLGDAELVGGLERVAEVGRRRWQVPAPARRSPAPAAGRRRNPRPPSGTRTAPTFLPPLASTTLEAAFCSWVPKA